MESIRVLVCKGCFNIDNNQEDVEKYEADEISMTCSCGSVDDYFGAYLVFDD